MELIDRDALRGRFEELDKVLDAPLSLILVGGGAVVALVEDAESTKDIDYIRTKELDELLRTQAGQKLREIAEELGFSDHSHAFEAYLPEDYLERSIRDRFSSNPKPPRGVALGPGASDSGPEPRARGVV